VIIELFGPAGSGKTTFAHALAHHLQARGYAAKVVLSYRPGVDPSPLDPGGFWYAFQRIGRATIRTAAFANRPMNNANGFRLTARLIRILTPRNPIWLMRFSQYILHLSVAWRRSHGTGQIVIFDQGFIQAVCSLGLFCRTANRSSLEAALALIPRSDIAINVDAAEPLLSERLRDRLSRQRYMERMFEADSNTNLQSTPIINLVKSLLLSKGRSVVTVETSDEPSLQESLFRVETEICEMCSRMAR